MRRAANRGVGRPWRLRVETSRRKEKADEKRTIRYDTREFEADKTMLPKK